MTETEAQMVARVHRTEGRWYAMIAHAADIPVGHRNHNMQQVERILRDRCKAA